ncbi:hypothetical protein A9R01_16750 ['Osedax' symbiont bacterium Rs2_46_30_T18]|nr:hypothetical protein A9R01_16750 ['Osedax' symbiont bacterium Rs2_46_30_T18]
MVEASLGSLISNLALINGYIFSPADAAPEKMRSHVMARFQNTSCSINCNLINVIFDLAKN